MRQILVTYLSVAVLLSSCSFFDNKKDDPKPLPESVADFPVDSLLKYPADDLYQRALSNMQDGDPQAALPFIEAALRKDSANYDYLLLGSDVFVAGEEIIKAQLLLYNGVNLFADSSSFPIRLAETFLYINQQEEALSWTNKALRLDPYNAYIYFLKGFAYKEMGDTTKALSTFQTSVEQDPSFYDGYMQLALLYSKKGDDIALQYIDNALSLQPKSREALYARAYHYQFTGRLQQAVANYKQAITVHARDEEFFYNMGVCYLDMDSIKQAYDHFEMATGLDPTYVEAYYMMGYVAESSGQYEQAKKHYNNALRLAPENSIVKDALNRLNNSLW